MSTDASAMLEMLKAKALLLLRREREVFQLRMDRSRTAAWLGAFQKLSQNLHGQSSEALFAQWVSSMVDDLRFQVGAIYRLSPDDRRMTLLCERAHAPLKPSLTLDEGAHAFMLGGAAGSYVAPVPAVLTPLADEMGLAKFLWMCAATQSSRFVLLAGFAPEAGRFHTLPDHDLANYRLFGAHLTALVDNLALIAELSAERSGLKQSNHQLDASLSELTDAQSRLVQSAKALAEASRRAGMADVATGVLHNVGNALNGVNVSAEMMVSRLQALKAPSVQRLAEVLAENAHRLAEFLVDDAHGRTFLPLLARLGASLVADRDEMLAEMQGLRGHIEHIKRIVSHQQAYAKPIGVAEVCIVDQLVDDAVTLAGEPLAQHRIEVTRDYQPVPQVLLDRHKVVQILVNLFTNAGQALAACARPDGRIAARIRLGGGDGGDGDGPQRVRIEIEDNGVGIAGEHMDKMFTHGFTTKRHGHGFGLHASALAAREMGGVLSCHSDGPGKGAAFALELPLQPAARMTATAIVSAAAVDADAVAAAG